MNVIFQATTSFAILKSHLTLKYFLLTLRFAESEQLAPVTPVQLVVPAGAMMQVLVPCPPLWPPPPPWPPPCLRSGRPAQAKPKRATKTITNLALK